MNKNNMQAPIGNIFAREEWHNGIKKFKRLFKKAGIRLKIESSNYESTCIFTFLSDEYTASSIDCSIEFSQEEDILYTHTYGVLQDREKDLFNRFFEELGALVKQLGMNVIIAKHQPYITSTPFENYKTFVSTST